MTPSWHAEHTPDAPAIIMGTSGEVVTYAQLEDRSARLARALGSRGVAVGDHIAILMENNRPYLEVAWAAQRSGLYYTAINTHLRAGEVQYILDDCGAVALISSEARADLVAGLDVTRIALRISAVGDLSGFERYDDLVAGAEPGPLAVPSPTSSATPSRVATWSIRLVMKPVASSAGSRCVLLVGDFGLVGTALSIPLTWRRKSGLDAVKSGSTKARSSASKGLSASASRAIAARPAIGVSFPVDLAFGGRPNEKPEQQSRQRPRRGCRRGDALHHRPARRRHLRRPRARDRRA
jgi:hypothetical protein